MLPVDPTIELLFDIRCSMEYNRNDFTFTWPKADPLFKIAKDTKYIGLYIDDIDPKILKLALKNPIKVLNDFKEFLIKKFGFHTNKLWVLKYITVYHIELKNKFILL